MSAILKAIDYLNKIIGFLSVLILVVMSGVISIQVFSRFILHNSIEWSEELARYLMIWLVFLAASLALRKHKLIGVEALTERLTPNVKRIFKTVVHIVNIGFFIVLMMYGMDMLEHVKMQQSPAMKIPMVYAYAAIPVGAFLMMMNSIAVLIEFYTKEDQS
ncbi:TRAP transporter small permease [Bacillus alveayuensis]|jgi:TRAP-type transport system small permease protein|uniref:TRAP transporter small permease n=1 Tax=Aeribacillus alveayuensis TaxID=279215 RepID=UPI0005D12C05|nr:TRAP transporter small permease [Bacillus alveayuensis]